MTNENNVSATENRSTRRADGSAKNVTKATAKRSVKPATPVVAENVTKATTWDKADVEKGRIYKATDIKMVSNADMDSVIGNIRKSGKALRALAHVKLCGYMQHYVEHGDYTKLYGFLSAIRDAMSRRMAQGVVDWVVAFSSLQYDKDSKTFKNQKGQERFFHLTGVADSTNKYHESGALNSPFYSTTFGDATPHQFDSEKYIESTLQRVIETLEREIARKTKAVEENRKRDANRIKVDPESIKRVKAAAKILHVNLKEAEPANKAAA